MATDMSTTDVPDEGTDARAKLSREMVRIYKQQLGRGPTKVRTNFIGQDIILITLEHTLTPAERTLASMGEHTRLRETRQFLQYAAEAEFRAAVERVTGRTVRGFVSGVDTKRDIASELFYLEPEAGAEPPSPAPR